MSFFSQKKKEKKKLFEAQISYHTDKDVHTVEEREYEFAGEGGGTSFSGRVKATVADVLRLSGRRLRECAGVLLDLSIRPRQGYCHSLGL